jgi:hypothetical protein
VLIGKECVVLTCCGLAQRRSFLWPWPHLQHAVRNGCARVPLLLKTDASLRIAAALHESARCQRTAHRQTSRHLPSRALDCLKHRSRAAVASINVGA